MQPDKYLWISSSSAESVMGACKGMLLHSSLPSSSNYPAVHPSSLELHIPQRNLWRRLDHPPPWVKLLTPSPSNSVTQAVLRAEAARIWRNEMQVLDTWLRAQWAKQEDRMSTPLPATHLVITRCWWARESCQTLMAHLPVLWLPVALYTWKCGNSTHLTLSKREKSNVMCP